METPTLRQCVISADANQSLLRIDKFLSDRLANVSRSKIQAAIKNGHITVNGHTVKVNYRIAPKDEVVVIMPNEKHGKETIIPQDIPLDVVYEDEAIIVINKIAGMVVHPGHGNWDGTLVNAVCYHFGNLPAAAQSAYQRPGLVHRIDKDTSGLVVLAKTADAIADLAKQFFEHTVERTYVSLVWGIVKQDAGTVVGHIGRSFKDRRLSTVFGEGTCGKYAVTHYRVLKRLRYVTLVACNLETGRTHQIRVHMKYLGHTVFGDITYGGDAILKGERFSKYKTFVENCFKILPRQALHAKTLGLVHPTTKQFMQFDSPLPTDMQTVIAKWERYVHHH